MIRGTYRLHSRFNRVINYVSDDGRITSLVVPEVGHGPGCILVRTLPDPAPPQLSVEEDRIVFGSHTIFHADLAPYDPTLSLRQPVTSADLDTKTSALIPYFPRASLAFLLDPSRESDFDTDFGRAYCAACKQGVALLASRRYEEGARSLHGLGFGLTPSGDDFLCGFLLALSLVTPRPDDARTCIVENAIGENSIVNHFLRTAYEGLFFERFKNFTRALCEGSGEDALNTFHPLRAIGATSGADTAAGLIIGLRLNR